MKMDKRLRAHTRPERVALFLAIAAGALGAAFLVAQAYFLARIIDRVFLNGYTLSQVAPLLAGLLVATGFRALLAWGGEVAASRLAVRVKTALRDRLYAHLLRLGPAYMRRERSGELVNTLTEGIEELDAYLRQYLPAIALAALVPVIVLLVVFPADTLTGVVLLVTGPLIPFFMIVIGIAAKQTSIQQFQAMSRLSAHFLDVLQGLTTLKVFNRSRAQVEIIGRVSDEFRVTTMKVLRVAFLSALVLELVATLSTAVVAVEVGVRLLYGNIAFEQALFVLILAPEFYMPLRNLGARFHAGASGITAAQRILDVLDTEPEVDAHARDGALPDGLRPAIRFENVVYAYDDGARPALRDLSFSIKPGERVALVGASGAGKSTVLNLLLRFNAVQHGCITVDGHDLAALPVEAWRQQIAWVPQNPYLFDASIAENIRLARPEAHEDEIMAAARAAYAHDFIMALPDGYATRIGERGARLSGGQAQRIALARAFLRDAPLVLLDEATANLDPEIEALVQAAMARLFEGRTVIVVAHRLNTVQNADRVLVMDGGRVVEAGCHSDLLRHDGPYRQLVTAFNDPALESPESGMIEEVAQWPA